MKTIVIGLDGASFELLDPWIEKGELPNFKKLKRMGIYGDLISCLPPVTAPNWKCYSTGKNPGKLGIFWWENIDIENSKVYYPQDRTQSPQELWDIIGKRGRVCVINMPTTYPPKKVNGFFISGPPDASTHKFFNPNTIQRMLKDFKYRIRPKGEYLLKNGTKKDQAKIVEEIKEITRTKFDLAHRIIKQERPIFLHLTIFYINVLHHFFWDHDFTKDTWKLIDKKVGQLLNDFNDEYTFFFISDHGSNKITQVFNINRWLEKNGYLVTTTGKKNLLNKVGINTRNLIRIFGGLGSETLRKAISMVPNRILNAIPTEEGTFNRERKMNVIDWKNSKVVASGQGPIYITKNKKKRIKDKLIKDLESMKQKKVIKGIYIGEKIYTGKYLSEVPDLILDQGKGIHIRDDIGRKKILEEPHIWKAENKRQGLFMVYGPNIKRGEKGKDLSILDVAPTILHLMNIPVPIDMDGRVLKEIFIENSEPARRERQYQLVNMEKGRVRGKIRRLKNSGKL